LDVLSAESRDFPLLLLDPPWKSTPRRCAARSFRRCSNFFLSCWASFLFTSNEVRNPLGGGGQENVDFVQYHPRQGVPREEALRTADSR